MLKQKCEISSNFVPDILYVQANYLEVVGRYVIHVVLFHYSDGVGRTGTFICIHSQLERLKTDGVVDVFQAIRSARTQRAGLVPSTVSSFPTTITSYT